MSMQTVKMTNKLGLQKSKSMLNTLLTKEKKVNPQINLNSSILEIKKKSRQPSFMNSRSNIVKYEIQTSTIRKIQEEFKANTLTMEKDSTVNFEEQELPSSKKKKNLQDKAKITNNKPKNSQLGKQSFNQRETVKPIKFKNQQKQKYISSQQRFNCSIRSNVYSFNSNDEVFTTKNNLAIKLMYEETVKKLNETIQQNKQLKDKLEKLKILNNQNRKSLKDQVANFNLQGQSAIKTKQTLQQLQITNIKLVEEILNIKNQNTINIFKIEQILNEKRHLEEQNQLQNRNMSQLKQIFMTLKLSYEQQTKKLQQKQQQIQQLLSKQSETMSLRLQSKLNRSQAYLDEVTDFSINSQIKDDQAHFKPILNQDPDILQLCKRLEQKYLVLINELKNRLLESQMQNFELETQLQKHKHSQENYLTKMDLSTQAEKLLLLMQNNRLKISQYQTKQQIKQLKEKLKYFQLQNNQLRVENEGKQEQLIAIQNQLTKNQQQEQFLRQDYQSFKMQLQESQETVKNLRLQKQQDILAKASATKKVKFFK